MRSYNEEHTNLPDSMLRALIYSFSPVRSAKNGAVFLGSKKTVVDFVFAVVATAGTLITQVVRFRPPANQAL